MWQARTVAALLEGTSAGGGAEAVTCEIVVVKTSGDRLQEAPLSEAGGKRLFVREIEDALLDGRVDVAVHSAKDMPAIAVEGLDDRRRAAARRAARCDRASIGRGEFPRGREP